MKIFDDISEFIFISNEPEDADILFIPGGSYPELAEKAAEIWQQNHVSYILPSGKYSIKRGYFPGASSKADTYGKKYNTEWDFLKDVLLLNGVREAAILKEDEATNTYQNSLYSKKVTDNLGLDIRKAIICCKAYHARRCLMYYQLAYPKTSFLVCPADTKGLNKENWLSTEDGINIVMGELERCGSQLSGIVKSFTEH